MNTQQMIEALNIPDDYVKPSMKPCDGNAFSIFSAVTKAVKSKDKDLANRYSDLCRKSDSYDTVLGVADALVEFKF